MTIAPDKPMEFGDVTIALAEKNAAKETPAARAVRLEKLRREELFCQAEKEAAAANDWVRAADILRERKQQEGV